MPLQAVPQATDKKDDKEEQAQHGGELHDLERGKDGQMAMHHLRTVLLEPLWEQRQDAAAEPSPQQGQDNQQGQGHEQAHRWPPVLSLLPARPLALRLQRVFDGLTPVGARPLRWRWHQGELRYRSHPFRDAPQRADNGQQGIITDGGL